MDFEVADLRRYLLGTINGKGLIERVAERVEEVSSSIAPRFRTNWYIPTRGAGHDNESAEGLIEKVFDLAVAMNEWLGRGIGSSPIETQQALLTYLRKNHVTDVAYLVGVSESDSYRLSEDDSRDLRHGKLSQVQDSVKQLLRPEQPPEQDVDRCVALMCFLRGWMGDCDHDFIQEPSDEGIRVMKCSRCGVRYSDHEGHREAVGG